MSLLLACATESLLVQELYALKNIEQITRRSSSYEQGANVAQISLDLGKTAMYFSRIQRVPRYADGERETDTEHSFMLALVAPELAAAIDRDLDIGLVSQYANVHDLIELKTNDVATFLFDDDQQHQKELDEHTAFPELLRANYRLTLPTCWGDMSLKLTQKPALFATLISSSLLWSIL